MNRQLTFSRAARTFAWPFLFVATGCAVLRVDVDVYKGPLADEEHVQMQRLAVMATGAKPLLEKLESDLKKDGSHPDDRHHENLLREVLDLYADKYDSRYAAQVDQATRKALRDIEEKLNRIEADTARLQKSYSEAYASFMGETEGQITDTAPCVDPSAGNQGSIDHEVCKFKRFQRTAQTYFSSEATGQKDAEKIRRNISTVWRDMQSLYAQLLQTVDYVQLDYMHPGAEEYSLSREQMRAIVALISVMTDHRKPLALPLTDQSCKNWDPSAPVAARMREWRGSLYDRSNALATSLMCNPSATVEVLRRENDRRISESTSTEEWRESLVYYQMGSGAKVTFVSAVSSFLDNFRIGFQLGGLRTEQHGLETLIANYLCVHDVGEFESGRCRFSGKNGKIGSNQPAEIERAQSVAKQALTGSLIRFAQKMLFASNNMIFVSDDCGKRSETTRHAADTGKTLSCAEVAGILEVVGNSVLTQANELHSREAHRQDMLNRQVGRRLAIKTVFSASPRTEFERTMALIATRADFLEKSNTDKNDAANKKNKIEEAISGAKSKIKEVTERIPNEEKVVAKSAKEELAIQNVQSALNDAAFNKCLADEKAKIVAVTPLTPDNAEKVVTTLFDRAMGCATLEEHAALLVDARKEMAPKFTGLRAALLAYAGERKLNVFASALESNLVTLKQAREADEAKLAKSKQQLAELKKELNESEALLPAALERVEAIPDQTDYAGQLADYDDTVLALLRTQGQVALNLDPALALRDRWNSAIEKWGGNGNAEESKRLREAANRVLDMTAQLPSMPAELIDGCAKDTSGKYGQAGCSDDVMYAIDMLITWLQTNRTSLLQFYGENSPEVRKIDEALDEAYLDRAGLTYIRPSSSYLRSSYASTNLQHGQSLGWDNMLDNMYQRTLPILGQPLERPPYIEVLDKIDKQYWQNINTVRVAGGGRTNYVLAKDDVGNWTARSFSSNFDKIVDSMTGLALHHYGAEIGASLADNDGKPRKESDIRLTPQTSGLGGLFAEYRDDFAKSRQALNTTLKDKVTNPSVEDQLKKVWSENDKIKDAAKLSDLKTKLGEHQATALKSVSERLNKESERAGFEVTYDTIRALRKFRDLMLKDIEPILTKEATEKVATRDKELTAARTAAGDAAATDQGVKDAEANLAKANEELDAAKAAAEAAKGTVTSLVTPLQQPILKRRDAAIAEYEKALTFIGEAINRDTKPIDATP